MFSTKKHFPKIILLALMVVTAIMGVLLFIHPPAIFPDPSWGFQVLRSMYAGGRFNQLVGPDKDDISQNYAEFITWWSPGQYLLPSVFKGTLHLSYGQASAMTVTFCELVGIAGFYTFFKRIGFSAMVSALSVLFIGCQTFYVIPYVFYNGGEVLLFAFAGWFLYGCFTFNRISIGAMLFVLLSGWIGFFCKASFMWIYASGVCCIWLRLCLHNKKVSVWVKNALYLGLPFFASVAGVYFFYLSKGMNPAGVGGNIKLSWETFTFPMAAPMLTGFSVDDLTQGLIYHPGVPAMFSAPVTLVVLLALAVMSIALVWLLIRKVKMTEYQLLLIVFYGVSILFFGYTFLKQAAITYEGRHFRIIGLIIVPGIIYLAAGAKWPYRAIVGLAWLAIFTFTIDYYVEGFNFNKDEGVHGPSGLTQQFLDQASLNYVTRLDRQSTNAIFAFISVDAGIEIVRNRIITLEPVGLYAKPYLEDHTYQGHAGPVHAVLPVEYLNGKKIGVIKACFPGYKRFEIKKLSDDFILCSAF